MQSSENLLVNAEQVRLKTRSILSPLTSAIVASSNRIMDGTTDYSVRRAALMWKIDAVPALREALFQPDPFTAIIDAWVMSFQMIDYFETGPGKEAFGEASAIAVTACRHIESEIHKAATEMSRSGEAPRPRAFAKDWAARHPIKLSIASRKSTLSRVTEREIAAKFSAAGGFANVVVTMDDINRRIEVYSAQLLDQARWQAELFAMDLAHQNELVQAMSLAERAVQSFERAVRAAEQAAQSAQQVSTTASQTAPKLERALAAVESMPRLLSDERAAALEVLQGVITRERTAALEVIKADLKLTIDFLHAERVAALDHLTREREAATADLRQTMETERKGLTADVERISLNVVDHTFRRTAQLVGAVVLVLLFAGAIALIVLVRSRRADAGA